MLRSHPRNRSTFKPSLEALETREVLNCTFTVNGTTLTIQAANSGSTITITDNGTGFGNNITAQCKGENAKTFASIQTLNFIGSNNKDKVTYNIVAPNGFAATRFININPMGGNDIINFNANNVNLVANSNLNVNIQQGTAAPTINASYSGVIGSQSIGANLTFVATAGLSPSVICGQFQINSGSIGTANITVNGGVKKDKLTLAVCQQNSGDPVQISAVVNGVGSGKKKDIVKVTPGVIVQPTGPDQFPYKTITTCTPCDDT
jgi:hypothetical protein